MKRNLYILSVTGLLLNLSQAQVPNGYLGQPYEGKAQEIPGRVELAWFDAGGEGVAYHDTEAANQGAEYNHRPKQQILGAGAADAVKFFRPDEGVDISFTKSGLDFTDENLVIPDVNQHYIGWQSDGEWTKYTVDVKVPGKYRVIALYSNQDNASELWLNGVLGAKLVLPEATGYWHHWNKAVVGEVILPVAGLNLLTLKYNEGANWAYFDFVLLPE